MQYSNGSVLFGGNNTSVIDGQAFSNDSQLAMMSFDTNNNNAGMMLQQNKTFTKNGSEVKEEDQVMFKTQLCRGYQRKGRCPYEYMCMFAHGAAELRTKQMNMADGLMGLSSVRSYQWNLKANGYSTKKRGSSIPVPLASFPSSDMSMPVSMDFTGGNNMMASPTVATPVMSSPILGLNMGMSSPTGNMPTSTQASPTASAPWTHNPYGGNIVRGASMVSVQAPTMSHAHGPCQCTECVAASPCACQECMQARQATHWNYGDASCSVGHSNGSYTPSPTVGMSSTDSRERADSYSRSASFYTQH